MTETVAAMAASIPGRSEIWAAPSRFADAVLSVDLAAIAENWNLLNTRLSQKATCGAVIKADAYGLGAPAVAQALAGAGCREFFVTNLDEAGRIKSHLPVDANVFVLHGLPRGAEAVAWELGVVPVLHDMAEIAAWRNFSLSVGQRLPAVLQVETGMSRLGLSQSDIMDLREEPDALAALDVKLIMSHLACSDTPEHPQNKQQLLAFRLLRRYLPGIKASLSNSSGIFLGADYHFDLVRPGAALYGINPTPGAQNPMRPVVRLQARVLQVRDVPAGTTVGYGAEYVATAPMRVATVGIGYADGFFRRLSRSALYWAGISLPVVGRVSMDMTTIDVTQLKYNAIAPGDFVDVINDKRTVDHVAHDANTIGYEVLTRLGQRSYRLHLK